MQIVFNALSYDDFIQKVEDSLEKKKKSISAPLKCCLDSNSWDRRVDQIIQAINEKWH